MYETVINDSISPFRQWCSATPNRRPAVGNLPGPRSFGARVLLGDFRSFREVA